MWEYEGSSVVKAMGEKKQPRNFQDPREYMWDMRENEVEAGPYGQSLNH